MSQEWEHKIFGSNKKMVILSSCSAALIAGLGGKMMLNPSYSPLQGVVYTITETTPHTSLDPLEGDKTNNLSVQKCYI